MAECFMRTLLVVLASELIKGFLLLTQVGLRWLGRGGLECAMHPFVPSVLLRLPRLDALDLQAQSHPLDR